MRKRTAAISILAALVVGLLTGLLGARFTVPAIEGAAAPTIAMPRVTPTPATTPPVMALPSPPPHTGNMPVLLQSVLVLDALKAKDYGALARLAAPEGITFTPYSTVDLEKQLTLTPEQLRKLDSDDTKYTWGLWMGSGEPITMTPAEYFERFVFNTDYTVAGTVGVDQITASGNAMENVVTVYPDCHFVEYHFPGLDPKKEGFDWCSLKLVFRTINEKPLLVGIIHSEWTT
ncbi:MAG: hypothetical protein RSC89_05730 [Oscillospiraceae bacterium]